VEILGNELFEELTSRAVASPRKRAHHNMHKNVGEPIHRLCIAAEPETYICPHRHSGSYKWELLTVLKGFATVFTYSEDGTVISRTVLDAGEAARGIEIDENVFHNFISEETGTVVLEVKSGPYIPTPEKDFASWAPGEGDNDVPVFMEKLKKAGPGSEIKAL
jgi:cupin fold WbuC family metalloprotein